MGERQDALHVSTTRSDEWLVESVRQEAGAEGERQVCLCPDVKGWQDMVNKSQVHPEEI